MQSPNHTYTRIPNAWDDLGLDPYARCLLLHYARRGECFESIDTTAKSCGMSRATVERRRKLLQERGLIEIVRQPEYRTCLVRVKASALAGELEQDRQQEAILPGEPVGHGVMGNGHEASSTMSESTISAAQESSNGSHSASTSSERGSSTSERATSTSERGSSGSQGAPKKDLDLLLKKRSGIKKLPTNTNVFVGGDLPSPPPLPGLAPPARASPPAARKPPGWTLAETPAGKEYFRQFGRKRWATPAQKQAFEECEEEVGTERMLEAVRWAATNNIHRVPAICSAARKGKHKRENHDGPPRGKQRWRLKPDGTAEPIITWDSKPQTDA